MFSVGICGTTQHTVMCAEALRTDGKFEVRFVLTPSPRLVGRKQVLTKNPLHVWAEKNGIDIIFVDKKIDAAVREKIENAKYESIDFLLVVDFGYIVPNWLLAIPQIAPVNIHPSDLPKYRGSSPGQFAMLYGDKKSAVSVIKMNDLLDQGDLIYQSYFDVSNTWMMNDYYQYAFNIISEQLPNILIDFAHQKIIAKPQPLEPVGPIARRLSREDGYLSWAFLSQLCEYQNEHNSSSSLPNSPLLKEVNQTVQNWPQTVANAVRALTPWPGVWTIVPTNKGDKRMKIVSVEINDKKLDLVEIQIEGQEKELFTNIKNQLK